MSANWPDVVDGTWPAASYMKVGPFKLREGRGGGSRVSAANLVGEVEAGSIDAAENAMLAMGQKLIFCLHPGDEMLDARLEQRGYGVLDPVNIYSCKINNLMDSPVPRVTVFSIWEPLAIMREIWAQCGIGPERLAVMDRVSGPKTGLLMRQSDQPAGTGFVAVHERIAMVHALEILPQHRRQGLGQWAMRAAAFWASDNKADTLSVICTKSNLGANSLYQSLGMQIVGEYHYRVKGD
ncbi:GNAT family N-acetyltransferase [Ruegeria arenilitoris]|uniref:GNAT family N-acetyltransferase n=1 Tax=Ruegeria arenilitoris TaxID=1173585 RepID=UPI00147ADF5B|nr:GNAT family N-acetyltransferase [Ruegeria arenilitoris]